MSFRDEVNENTRTLAVETLIRTVFTKPHRKFGDIIEDLLESDEIDDDWMKETLFEMEISEFVQAGMRIMGLSDDGEDPPFDDSYIPVDPEEVEDDISENGVEEVVYEDEEIPEADEEEDDGVIVEEDEEGTTYSAAPAANDEPEEAEEEPRPKKKRKKKKKKKKAKSSEDAPRPPKKKKKATVESTPARAPREDAGPEWKDYKKLVVKTMRGLGARSEEDAVNNSAILNEMHGEDNWDGKEEGAALRQALTELHDAEKVGKRGKARGTRYYLN